MAECQKMAIGTFNVPVTNSERAVLRFVTKRRGVGMMEPDSAADIGCDLDGYPVRTSTGNAASWQPPEADIESLAVAIFAVARDCTFRQARDALSASKAQGPATTATPALKTKLGE
jgi:hypothetical protein